MTTTNQDAWVIYPPANSTGGGGGGPGSDTTAIHDNVANEISGIATKATPTTADILIIEDAAASFAKKKITIGTLPGGGGGGQTDTVAGSLGITNTGDNINATLTPTYGSAASTVCEGDDSRLSDARVPTGAAGGDLAGTYASPSVSAITTTTGPTSLTIGAIAIGETLRRVGSTVVGYTPAAGGGWSVVTETTAARSAMADEFILVAVSTCAVTLPPPVASLKVAIKAINSPTTDVRILTSGAGILIDGTDYSSIGLELKKQYEQISVISDGTDWFIY